MIKGNSLFAAVDQVAAAPWGAFGAGDEVDGAPFGQAHASYYMTDPVSRASETMARCTEELASAKQGEATGTHG